MTWHIIFIGVLLLVALTLGVLLILKNREHKIRLRASEEGEKIDRMFAAGKISQSEATELKRAVGVYGRYEVTGQVAGGKMSNRDIMAMARNVLHGQWMMYALYMLIFCILYTTFDRMTTLNTFQKNSEATENRVVALGDVSIRTENTPQEQKEGSSTISIGNEHISIGSFLISGAVELGFAIFFLSTVRKGTATFSMLFDGFKKFLNAFLLYWFQTILIILWMLLFIVPGILAALSYSMAFYILADNPGISIEEAISRSKKMMYGHRWRYFCLNLRFIGWAILSLLTLGIGFLWLVPYVQTSWVLFYEDLRQTKKTQEVSVA